MRIAPTAVLAGFVGAVVKCWVLMAIALFIYDSIKLRKEGSQND